MPVFSRQQATAQKLIKKNGISGIIRRNVIAVADPLKPWVQVPDHNDVIQLPVYIVVFPFDARSSSQQTRAWAQSNPELVTGLSEGLMSSTQVIPKLNDIIIAGGRTFNVMAVNELAPNLVEKILFTLTLKE